MLEQVQRREKVPWGETELILCPPTVKAKGAMKEHFEREAVAAWRRKRDMLSESEYAAALLSLSRDFAARTYAYGKPEFARCLADEDHYKHWLRTLLLQEVLPEKKSLNPTITADVMDRIWDELTYEGEDGTLRNHLDEAYGRLMAPDPNAKRPAPASS